MHSMTELPDWEHLFKRVAWRQIGDIEGKSILAFGSGEGVTADHYSMQNEVA